MKKKKNSLNPLIIFLATIIIVLSIIYGIFINPIKQENDYIKEHSKFDVHFENITYTLTWDNGEEIKETDIIEKNSRRKVTIHIQDDNEEYIDIYQKYNFTLNMNFIKTK